MPRNSIELTLQQLIDLGVIKLKNKKQRKKLKRTKVPKISNDIFSQNKASSSHMRGYSTPNHLPMLQQNTEALRLRDDNQNLNTRVLEQKQLLENSKQDAAEFQNKTQAAFMHVFNTLSVPTIGYSDYDADGAFGGSDGSDYFRSMRDVNPDATVRMPDYIPPESGPVIEEVDDDVNSAIVFDKRDTFYPKAAEEQAPSKNNSLFGRLSKGLFSSGGGSSSSSAKKKAASNAAHQSYHKIDDNIFGDASHVDSAAEYEAETSMLRPDDEPSKEGRKKPHTPLSPRPPTAQKRKQEIRDDFLTPKVAGGGVTQLPEIYSDDFLNVPKSMRKPTKGEMIQFRNYYKALAGDDADPVVLASSRRNEIEQAIVKIQLEQYTQLGGDNKQVLRSTDCKQIGTEIAKLKRLKQILAYRNE